MKNSINEFWVTNISKLDVSLSDLNLTIRAFTSVNLLSKKYNYKLEQLDKSVKSGSIFKKRNKIIKRLVPPAFIKFNVVGIDQNAIIPTRIRSMMDIKYEKYEELNVSDEEFASENADLADSDFSNSKT